MTDFSKESMAGALASGFSQNKKMGVTTNIAIFLSDTMQLNNAVSTLNDNVVSLTKTYNNLLSLGNQAPL